MRPYFFKRPTASEDKRAKRYQARQRGAEAANEVLRFSPARRLLLGALGMLGGLFGANREVAAWLRTQDTGLPIHIVKAARDKSIEAARAKRERRKKKAIAQALRSGEGLWKISWANDKTWRRA